MSKLFTTVIVLFFFLILPKNIYAVEDYASDFVIETIPDNPSPGKMVSAKITSYQFDVNRSDITWTLDGKKTKQGKGEKSFDFVLPPFGNERILTVDIITPAGIKTSKTKKFSGSDIDFLWEARTTTPAGYKGKSLASRGSVVKITALPHLFSGSKILPRANIVYEWTLNYKNLPDSSGTDRNTLAIRLNDMGDFVVGLKVSTLDKRASFQKYLHLSAEGASPKIVFYADDPLGGPSYNKAIKNKTTILQKSLTLLAEPYFFSLDKGEEIFSWAMNDKIIKPTKRPNAVSFMAEKNSGEARIDVKFKKEFLGFVQSEEESVEINF